MLALLDRSESPWGPWPSLVLMLLAQHYWQSPSTAQHDLGAHPRDLSTTLVDSIDWYRMLGYC